MRRVSGVRCLLNGPQELGTKRQAFCSKKSQTKKQASWAKLGRGWQITEENGAWQRKTNT